MRQRRDFYRQYRQYILSDGLMYLVFVLALGLMFTFLSYYFCLCAPAPVR